MKKLLTLSLLAVAATTVNASTVHKPLIHRDSGFYIGFNASSQSESLNEKKIEGSGDTVLPGFVFGYKFSKPIRMELDLKLRASQSSGAQITAAEAKLKGSVNAYYDIYTSTIFTPYLSVGLNVGATVGALKDSLGNSKARALGYNAVDLGAGTRVRLSDHLDLDLQYRYGLGSAKFAAKVNESQTPVPEASGFNYHQATIGLIYNF